MKIAIITGASSGMGREMVFQLADRFSGLDEIWVTARRAERLDGLNGKVPVHIRKFPLDLTCAEDLQYMRETLSRLRPDVKILVNAAGYGKVGAVGEIPADQTAGMIRLNDEALVAVTELVLPYISENSRIIQFASAAAFLPQPGFAVYAASKAFVLSYSRALHAELRKRRIYVTAVCPGPVDTEFFDVALDGEKLTFLKKIAMIRPETVVRRAVSDSCMGREISIPGIPMRTFFLLCKLLPHNLIVGMIRWKRK